MVQTVEAPSKEPTTYFNRTWVMAFLEGLFAVAIGTYLLIRPAFSLAVLVGILGVYWLVSGVFKSISALSGERWEWWWTRLTGGILLVALGMLVLAYPLYRTTIPITVLAVAAAFLAMVSGIFTASWGVNRGGIIFGDGWVLMSGLLSILFGFILLATPFVPLRTADTLIGAVALLDGAGQVISAFSLRRRSRKRRGAS